MILRNLVYAIGLLVLRLTGEGDCDDPTNQIESNVKDDCLLVTTVIHDSSMRRLVVEDYGADKTSGILVDNPACRVSGLKRGTVNFRFPS